MCAGSTEFAFGRVVGFLLNLQNTSLEVAKMQLDMPTWRSGGGFGFGNV